MEHEGQGHKPERKLLHPAMSFDERLAHFPEWEHEMGYCTPEMSILTQHYRHVTWAIREAWEHPQDMTDEEKDALQGQMDAFLSHVEQVNARLDAQSAARREQLARVDAAWKEVNAALDNAIAIVERLVAKPAGDEVH